MKPTYASPTKLRRLVDAEKALIGTLDYQAQYSYFHAYEYRHELRPIAGTKKYLRVYRALLKAGLDPAGESELHRKIIERIVK